MIHVHQILNVYQQQIVQQQHVNVHQIIILIMQHQNVLEINLLVVHVQIVINVLLMQIVHPYHHLLVNVNVILVYIMIH